MAEISQKEKLNQQTTSDLCVHTNYDLSSVHVDPSPNPSTAKHHIY